MIFYGVYFGVMGRDCAELCVDYMAAKMTVSQHAYHSIPHSLSSLCSKLGKVRRKALSSLLTFFLFFSTQLLGSLYQKWSLLTTCVPCVAKGSSYPLLTVRSQQRGRTDYPAITCILAFQVCCCCCCCCVYMFVVVVVVVVVFTCLF